MLRPTWQRKHQKRQQREMREADPDEDRAPADLHKQGGKHGDHDQLPDAHAGDDRGIGESGATRKGARHDHADGRERGEAVADSEHDAVEHQRVPRLRYEAHEPDPEPADDHAGIQQRARARPVGQAAGVVGRERRYDDIGADREAELAARPAELVDHRLECEPDREAGAAADEQDQKAGGEYGGRIHCTCGSGVGRSVTCHAWIRCSILATEPFDAIRSRFQLQIDIGISHLIACSPVADHEEDGILLRHIQKMVTVAGPRREADAHARPDGFATRVRDEHELALDHVDELILFRMRVTGR